MVDTECLYMQYDLDLHPQKFESHGHIFVLHKFRVELHTKINTLQPMLCEIQLIEDMLYNMNDK